MREALSRKSEPEDSRKPPYTSEVLKMDENEDIEFEDEETEKKTRVRAARYQCRQCWSKGRQEYKSDTEPAPTIPCDCGFVKVLKTETGDLFLFRLHNEIQKTRVQCDVRLSHLMRSHRKDERTEGVSKKIKMIEDEIAKEIEKTVDGTKLWEDWASMVKGLGKYSLGKLMAAVDIEWAGTVSQLWRFAGFMPGEKREKGQVLHFSMALKTHCWKVGTSLMRAKGRYYMYYCEQKKRYEERFTAEGLKIVAGKKGGEKEGEISKGHIHMMALRKMIKLFLSHFWSIYRQSAGLPVTKPYVNDQLKHDTYYEPFIDEGMEIVKPKKSRKKTASP